MTRIAFITPMLAIAVCVAVLIAEVCLAQDAGAPERSEKAGAATASKRRKVTGTIKRLGNNEPIVDFTFIVLLPVKDGFMRERYSTDGAGKFDIELPQDRDVRFFATGDFVIPASWARLGRGTEEVSIEIFVRPLKKVKLQGHLTIENGQTAGRANVYVAELDLLPDGSFLPFEEPMMVYSADDGSYEIEVLTGYYTVRAIWSDEDWIGFTVFEDQVEVFDPKTLDLKLTKGPQLKGKVVDGITGEPADCFASLFTNAYFSQRNIYSEDAETPEGGSTGIFDTQVKYVDPRRFDVILRLNDENTRAIQVMLDMDVEKFGAEVMKIRSPDRERVTVTLLTGDGARPMSDVDISITPLSGEPASLPVHLRSRIELSGYTADNGTISFWGLPAGGYTVYADRGGFLLGELEVDGSLQDARFRFPGVYAYGSLKYPDGTVCRAGDVELDITTADGYTFTVSLRSAYRNKSLSDDGLYFVWFQWPDATYRLKFGAPEPGDQDSYFLSIDEMPYVSEPLVIEKPGDKGVRKDISLKKNPKLSPPKKDE